MKVSDLVESVVIILNEEWYDAYRDFKGSGMSDSEARAAANRMYPDEAVGSSYGHRKSYGRSRTFNKPTPQPKPDVKPELTHWVVFSNVTDDKAAIGSGLKQFASGPRKGSWWFGLYNTSGKTAEAKLKAIEEKFGKGTKIAVPKK